MTIEIAFKPYEGVDFDTLADPTGSGYPVKENHHLHSAKWPGNYPHDLIDLVVGDGPDGDGNTLDPEEAFTLTNGSDRTHNGQLPFPWTEMNDINSDWEDRDPASVRDGGGVISFPGGEFHAEVEEAHDNRLFTTFVDFEDTLLENIQGVTSAEDDKVPSDEGGLSAVAHPKRYYGIVSQDWDRYEEEFSTVSLDDGLIGMEVLNKNSVRYLRGTDRFPDIELWDRLLTHFMPERPVFAIAEDDPNDFRIGHDINVRWTWVLLDEDDFDPSDQDASRIAAAKAFRSGAIMAVQRRQYDPDGTRPDPATINDITVDESAETITIDAPGEDEIRWISRGRVVETGDQIDLEPDHIPYVRAEVWTNPDTLVLTQPWGLDGDFPGEEFRDAKLNYAELGHS